MKESYIRKRLAKKGYYITQTWGLILEKGQEEAIADIRTNRDRNSIMKGYSKVALSQITPENSASIEKLESILRKEGIPYKQSQVFQGIGNYHIR